MTVVVLGGGISGLSAAYYLTKSTRTGARIYESSKRLGGWIKSTRTPSGVLFEQGPRTLRCTGDAAENTLQLVRDLGLSRMIRPVHRSSPAAKNRMIYHKNRVISLPNSWVSLFKINPPFIRPFLFAVVKDLTTAKRVAEDESVYDFVSRRFGQDYADIPLSAMICGIFAGDAKEISVKALMSSLFEREQEHGSVIRGTLHTLFKPKTKTRQRDGEAKTWSVWSLEDGLETLPTRLSQHLQAQDNLDIHLGAECTKVTLDRGQAVLTINGQPVSASHLHSCLPSRTLAQILDDDHPDLKRDLMAIPFVSVAVVNLEYDGDLIENKGFGLLVPPGENLPILGIIFDSCIFPQEGKTVLTVMMGGKWFDRHFGRTATDQKKYLDTARDHVGKILGIRENPVESRVTVLRECIPQYTVGHSARVQRMRQYIRDRGLPLTLIGNSYDGVGVNDAILSARRGVEEAVTST